MKQNIAKFDAFVLKHSQKAVKEIEQLGSEERQILAWVVVMFILLVGITIKGMRLL